MFKTFAFVASLFVHSLFALELPVTEHPFGLPADDPRLEELGQELSLPAIGPTGLVPVFNSGGGTALVHIDPTSAQFIAWSKEISYPVLEIGAAFGFATLPVLHESQNIVIADDIGVENLLLLRKRADAKYLSRLFLNTKRFPQELDFPEESLGGILICRVFHFLRGEEIEEGLAKAYRWLIPGGKIFIVTSTQYQSNLVDFVATYDARWESGNSWPGYVDNYASTATFHRNLNPFLHVMDDRPLRRALEKAGFQIEEARFIDRRKTMPPLSVDGREGIGVIAVKKS